LYGESAIAWCQTALGAKQRSWLRTSLLFAHPWQVPDVWLEEQERMSQMPGFLKATVSSLRAQLNVFGQHQVLLDSLGQLQMPTLVVWDNDDLVLQKSQGQDAVSRLQQGQLALIPDCGHLPHVERSELFTEELSKFLTGLGF
jgi:pimeloyl-ACP methyl ester carboxylesterase